MDQHMIFSDEDVEKIAEAASLLSSALANSINSIISNIAANDVFYLFKLPKTEQEQNKDKGFVCLGNDTWQPKALYEAKKQQQQREMLVPKNGIIWTGK